MRPDQWKTFRTCTFTYKLSRFVHYKFFNIMAKLADAADLKSFFGPTSIDTNRDEPTRKSPMFIGPRSMFRVSGIGCRGVGRRTDRKNQEPPQRRPRPRRFESVFGEFALDECNRDFSTPKLRGDVLPSLRWVCVHFKFADASGIRSNLPQLSQGSGRVR